MGSEAEWMERATFEIHLGRSIQVHQECHVCIHWVCDRFIVLYISKYCSEMNARIWKDTGLDKIWAQLEHHCNKFTMQLLWLKSTQTLNLSTSAGACRSETVFYPAKDFVNWSFCWALVDWWQYNIVRLRIFPVVEFMFWVRSQSFAAFEPRTKIARPSSHTQTNLLQPHILSYEIFSLFDILLRLYRNLARR